MHKNSNYKTEAASLYWISHQGEVVNFKTGLLLIAVCLQTVALK